ncbi:hypothetical protein KI387_016192, partial [Taxus chinensis]
GWTRIGIKKTFNVVVILGASEGLGVDGGLGLGEGWGEGEANEEKDDMTGS